ncbi:MAG: molybdopterin molybdotransferase MoeA [Proteobacteria bacterium]|nr:molybdopterin molybdotransferase MoeA [Pseudomonadota bacterium]
MFSVNEAIDSLLDGGQRLVESEEVDLISALGRTLAEDIIASMDVPPADNSAMDGYAFRQGDWQDAQSELPISQRITAGSVPQALEPGTVVRIFTGAQVPAGADTVVMQEHCEGSQKAVRILRLPAMGANIRPRGQDITTGQKILPAGHRMRGQDMGLLASQGIDKIPVYQRLKVAILSTGDELIEPGRKLRGGQIYNSNRFTMHGQLAAWGFEVVDLGIARDDPEAIRELFETAAATADVILSSGGVSVGEEDHVKDVVESLGSIDLWKIAIKPGKPFAFGQVKGTPFLGLPGNPVSVFVTMLIIGRPYLFCCQGTTDTTIHAVLHTACFEKRGSAREDYLRVRLGEQGLEPFSSQSSGVLLSTSWGDGLVRQRVHEDIKQGDRVEFLPWPVLN